MTYTTITPWGNICPPSHARVLDVLADAGPLTMPEIARRLDREPVTSGAVAISLRNLARSGLVRRIRRYASVDGRVPLTWELTERAREIIQRRKNVS